MHESAVVRGKSKEAFDLHAVSQSGPHANLPYLCRICSDAFSVTTPGDHMFEKQNPFLFLEDKVFIGLSFSPALDSRSNTCFQRSNSSPNVRPITITSSRSIKQICQCRSFKTRSINLVNALGALQTRKASHSIRKSHLKVRMLPSPGCPRPLPLASNP